MKRSLLIVPVLVALAAGSVLFLGGPPREFTTSSQEAYDLYEEGVQNLLSFRFADAESTLTGAIELDERFVMARAVRATLLARLGRFDEIKDQVALLDSMASELPNDVERAKVQLQLSGLSQGGMARSDSLLSFLLAEAPDDLLVLNAEANMLYAKDEPGAREAFLHILEIEPNSAFIYNMLGHLEAKEGDYDAALTHLKKYAFMAPELANPHDSLAMILAQIGEYERAEQEYATALKLDPDFHFSLKGLAEIYMEQGMLTKGAALHEKLRTVMERNRSVINLDQSLIQILYSFEFRDELVETIRKFVASYPEEFGVEHYQALLAGLEGRPDEGRAIIAAFMEELELKEGPKPGPAVMRRLEAFPVQFDAVIAAWNGDHAAAAAAWSAFRDSTARDTPLHEMWRIRWCEGRSRLATGDARRALELGIDALDPNPNRIPALLLVAEAALALDERAMARSALEQARPLLERADQELPAQLKFLELMSRLTPGVS